MLSEEADAILHLIASLSTELADTTSAALRLEAKLDNLAETVSNLVQLTTDMDRRLRMTEQLVVSLCARLDRRSGAGGL